MYSPDDTNVCGSRGGEFEGIAVGAEICKIVFLWGNFLFTSSDTFAVDAPFSHNTHRHRQTERQQYHANSIWVWSAKNQWRMVTHEGPEHVNLLHKIPFQLAPFTFLNTYCKNNLKTIFWNETFKSASPQILRSKFKVLQPWSPTFCSMSFRRQNENIKRTESQQASVRSNNKCELVMWVSFNLLNV